MAFEDKEDQMTGSDVAKHFNEPVPKEKELPDFSKMTKEEIEGWEKAQNESSDIYRIAARVKNLARVGGASLTPVGEMLCNCFVHVIKDLYDFADTLEKDPKEALIKLLQKHENMPANLIAATKSGAINEQSKRTVGNKS